MDVTKTQRSLKDLEPVVEWPTGLRLMEISDDFQRYYFRQSLTPREDDQLIDGSTLLGLQS